MRSSGRIPKEIPIVLIGSDLDGRIFSEQSRTVLLSLHGAGILSRHKLSPEQELVLRWAEKNKEADIRIVGHIGSQGDLHTYGAAFFDQNLNFWEIEFPPITDWERDLGLLTLVCTSCRSVEKIDDTSVEADVCATNESVLRNCKRCAAVTLWRPASAVPPPAPAQPAGHPSYSEPTPQPVSVAPPAPPQTSFYARSITDSFESGSLLASIEAVRQQQEAQPVASVRTIPVPASQKAAAAVRINRRKHPRIKVSYAACVRHPVRGEEIVTCEDMSKGGLRFKCAQRYYAQSLIEVAVPYQKGQTAIFVPAQIVFVEELPEQRLFRYGVQYLQAAKPRDGF